MKAPHSPPDAGNVPEWREFALAYLQKQLGERAPAELGDDWLFEHSPLDGEGQVVVFEFQADVSGQAPERFYVAVGKTEPNYYPAYGLTAEEAFELHLGTRFMLVIGVAQVGIDRAPDFDAVVEARSLVERVAPGEPVDAVEVAAAFDVDGQLHVVLRCRIAGEPVYVMAGDAPPGFLRRTDLPPQVAYRVHIGHVLRQETESLE